MKASGAAVAVVGIRCKGTLLSEVQSFMQSRGTVALSHALGSECSWLGATSLDELDRSPGSLPDILAHPSIDADRIVIVAVSDCADHTSHRLISKLTSRLSRSCVVWIVSESPQIPLPAIVESGIETVSVWRGSDQSEGIVDQLALAISHFHRNAMIVRARVRASESSKNVMKFFASLSHELRTPLSAILGYVELLTKSGLRDDQRERVLSALSANGAHLRALLNDLLDLAKMESTKRVFSVKPVSPKDLMADLERLFRPAMEQKGLKFSVQVSSNLPERLLLDGTAVMRVLINLVSNALKYTEHGSVSVTAAWLPTVSQFRVSVVDSGPGLTPQEQSEVFEPFVRLGGEEADLAVEGSGLGLAISKRLAEQLGGGIEIESSRGRGTCFALWITAEESNDRSVPRQTQVRTVGGTNGDKTPRILIVDDSREMRHLIGASLSRRGYKIVEAASGEAAIAAVQKLSFDLVLLDLQLPTLDGIATASQLRAGGFEGAIVAVSGDDEDRLERLVQDGAFTHWLRKPFTGTALLYLLSTIVRPPIEASHGDGGRDSQLLGEATLRVSLPADLQLSLEEQESVVDEFLTNLEREHQRLEHALKDDNRSVVQEVAHRLKAAGLFGFPKLAARARELEIAARANDDELRKDPAGKSLHDEVKKTLTTFRPIEVSRLAPQQRPSSRVPN